MDKTRTKYGRNRKDFGLGQTRNTTTKKATSDSSCIHTESDNISISIQTTPYSAQWISEELLFETRKIWSKAYKRVISNDEAIEILMNVKRMAEILIRMQKESDLP